MRTIAIDDVFVSGFTDAGDGNGKPCERCSGVATYNIHIPFLTGFTQAGVEFFEVFHREALAESNAHHHLAWRAVHGKNVAEVDHSRLVAQMAHGDVCEVEMNAFHEHVSCDEHFAFRIGEHGAVVAYAIFR